MYASAIHGPIASYAVQFCDVCNYAWPSINRSKGERGEAMANSIWMRMLGGESSMQYLFAGIECFSIENMQNIRRLCGADRKKIFFYIFPESNVELASSRML